MTATIAEYNSEVPNRTIHYTLDGSDPTLSSPLYTGPKTYQPGLTLNARVFAPGWWTSPLASAFVPANDSFANRIAVSASSANSTATSYYPNKGGSKEPGEPDHAGNSGGHSLWWEWTSSYNTPAKVYVQDANYDTLLAVYTGTAVSQLTPVASNDDHAGETNSMLTFQAAAGAKYQIALDGKNGVIGSARIRIVQEPLVAITDNTTIVFAWADPNIGSIAAQVSCVVQNFGTAASGPLQLRFVAQRVRGNPLGEQTTLTNFLVSPNGLSGGQWDGANLSAVLFTAYPGGGFPPSDDWTYYLVLEEQFGGQWLIQDAMPLPHYNPSQTPQIIGPNDGPPVLSAGGNPGGAWHPVALTGKTITAPTSVTEGQTYSVFATVYFDNNTSCSFSNTTWTTSLPGTIISTNGVLQVGIVSYNTNLTIVAPFVYQGTTNSVSQVITITNLPPPALSNLVILPGPVVRFTLNGVPNRLHAIQTSTNLVNWSVVTNQAANTNGVLLFTDPAPGAARQRFYRALELP